MPKNQKREKNKNQSQNQIRSHNHKQRPVQILIVEDVESMRSFLEVFLGAIADVKVSGVAKNTWEARIALTRQRPDLVLLDEILPGESSLDLLKEINAHGIPVLLMTGLERPTHPLPDGACARLSKPAWDSVDEDRERFKKAILKAAP